MNADEIIRRWKEDEDSQNPAGSMEITDEELLAVRGGIGTDWHTCTCHTCGFHTVGACCTLTRRPHCH